MRRLLLPLLILVAAALAGALTGGHHAAAARPVSEVVVQLAAPPLAYDGSKRARARIDAEQRRFVGALRATVPDATVRWRYRIVTNGLAVALPGSEIRRLGALPGVKRVYFGSSYQALAGPDAATIKARQLPEPPLATDGAGVKIAIIDDGVDQTHPFFDPTGYTMPAGFPKGQVGFTTAKVIVARSFVPPGTTWRYAGRPFDPQQSEHAMHVAGIAAGNANTLADGARIGGIAPRAYIGNYKALTIPTDANVGLDGNAPELVAAIEAAVQDGMDVINLSIGEPEIAPQHDVVALALDAAAAAGVVPVVAAGNDFNEFGAGSLASPGTSERAITVGATTSGASPAMASFSSSGPTPISLRLKPDVVAPGTAILSAQPGGWGALSGTSMATPHVSGAVALLLQRHPDWSPEQVKAALTVTARPVGAAAASPTRTGAGLVDVAAADQPLVRPTPTAVSFGLVPASTAAHRDLRLDDAGGGAGTWSTSFEPTRVPDGTALSVPAQVVVPGTLALDLAAGGREGELGGVIVLRRDGVARRIPVWGRISVAHLAAAQAPVLRRPGIYTGNTRGRASSVDVYRYPEVPDGGMVTSRLRGPEQVFRVELRRQVANVGVVITSRKRGVRVEPRFVENGDENRLTGYAALPFDLNPYVDEFEQPTLASGAIAPLPGTYAVVFDSPTRAGAGAFTFRFWVDDTTPPSARLTARSVRVGLPLRARVRDTGAGVDPRSLEATVDGRTVGARLVGNEVRVSTIGVEPGTHRLRLSVADYQETRNMENVARILPNTRVLTASVTVRRR
ncbi:MAG TPA: S8 family serine peptidase [Gaiella sp.]|nr:S8 family serine peptidase [Gaiella sp.]